MTKTRSEHRNNLPDSKSEKTHLQPKDADKREVYKSRTVVDTYDHRLYFGLSGGLFYKREMSRIEDWFPRSGKILDAPCGTGKLARFLKDRGGLELYGVDISPLMIEAASKAGTYHKLEVGDLANLSYPNGFFDVIYVSRFFMLFPDIKLFLKEITRVLKPGGLLIFDNIRRSIHNLVNATIGTAEGLNYPRKTAVMRKIVREAGLSVVDQRSAFLFSTGIMNRMPPFLFKFFSAIERVFPECCRVMEFYKTTKIISKAK